MQRQICRGKGRFMKSSQKKNPWFIPAPPGMLLETNEKSKRRTVVRELLLFFVAYLVINMVQSIPVTVASAWSLLTNDALRELILSGELLTDPDAMARYTETVMAVAEDLMTNPPALVMLVSLFSCILMTVGILLYGDVDITAS
jgi:hypothetical protein